MYLFGSEHKCPNRVKLAALRAEGRYSKFDFNIKLRSLWTLEAGEVVFISAIDKMDVAQLIDIANDPAQTRWIAPLLFIGDAVLSNLVVWKIPCKLRWSLRAATHSKY